MLNGQCPISNKSPVSACCVPVDVFNNDNIVSNSFDLEYKMLKYVIKTRIFCIRVTVRTPKV